MKRLAILWFCALLSVPVFSQNAPSAESVSVRHPAGAIRGAPNARVTIVVFSDFECTFCKRLLPTLEQVLNTYPHDVRLLFKHRPLPKHPNAVLAHQAAMAAAAQGAFWEMHDLLFANQGSFHPATLVRYAKRIGLDTKMFRAAIEKQVFRSIVERDMVEADGLGVTSTPTVFINGRHVLGAKQFSEFKIVIDEELGLDDQK